MARCSRTIEPPNRSVATALCVRESQRPPGVRMPPSPCQAARALLSSPRPTTSRARWELGAREMPHDGFQGGRALQDRDPPAAVVQGHRRGEAADSTADDDGMGLVHDSSSNPRTPVLRSSGKPEIRDPEHRNYTRSDGFTVLRM